MVKLLATQGSDEANYGQDRFRVDNDGTVDVPPEAVEPLIKTGGFVLANLKFTPSPGLVKVRRKDGAGVSYGGISYEPDTKGVIIVPAEAAEELGAHGFLPVGETLEQVKARAGVRIPDSPEDGLAMLQGEPGQGVSWGGGSYTADEDGFVVVPLSAVTDLQAHGFEVSDTKAPDTAPQPEPIVTADGETITEPVTEPTA